MTTTAPTNDSTYAAGTLVRARGREWVVQPGSDHELLILRPLGGADDDIRFSDEAETSPDAAPEATPTDPTAPAPATGN